MSGSATANRDASESICWKIDEIETAKLLRPFFGTMLRARLARAAPYFRRAAMPRAPTALRAITTNALRGALVSRNGALLVGSSLSVAGSYRSFCSSSPFHALTGKTMSGATVPFDTFEGKPVLMLNVASR